MGSFTVTSMDMALLERVASCQQREKNEIIFVLAAYAKNGTNEQKLHLIENDFIEIIMENVEMKEFYDLVIDCVISLVRAFVKTEGKEKALDQDLCDENGIPDLIDNAINGEDPEIASRAEQFKAELNVDDDSDGD